MVPDEVEESQLLVIEDGVCLDILAAAVEEHVGSFQGPNRNLALVVLYLWLEICTANEVNLLWVEEVRLHLVLEMRQPSILIVLHGAELVRDCLLEWLEAEVHLQKWLSDLVNETFFGDYGIFRA